MTVTLENEAEVEAKLDQMIEDTRRKVASGEIVLQPAEPEVEPCDCPGCLPHLGPDLPCEKKNVSRQ